MTQEIHRNRMREDEGLVQGMKLEIMVEETRKVMMVGEAREKRRGRRSQPGTQTIARTQAQGRVEEGKTHRGDLAGLTQGDDIQTWTRWRWRPMRNQS